MNKKALITILSLISIGLLASVASGQWNPQTVDNSGDVGYDSSVAYDSQGNPHIAYCSSAGELRYAYFNGLSWRIESIDSGSWHPCIGIDPQDNPRIAVYRSSYNIRYWSRSSVGTWSYEVVATNAASPAGQRVSLVLVNDVPHVAYWQGPQLRYAYKSGGSWPNTLVDSGTNLGQYASMAIDASGSIYISYYDGGGTDLRFAYRNPAGTWATFTVDGATVDVGQYSSLVLDQSGVPHVCYYDATNHQLKHATITSLP